MKTINTTTKAAQSPAEIIAHLTDAQRLQVLHDAAADTFARKPLREYRGRFSTSEVVALFASDRTEDEKISLTFGHLHVATRGELSSMILHRQSAMAAHKPDLGIDHALADALAADDS